MEMRWVMVKLKVVVEFFEVDGGVEGWWGDGGCGGAARAAPEVAVVMVEAACVSWFGRLKVEDEVGFEKFEKRRKEMRGF